MRQKKEDSKSRLFPAHEKFFEAMQNNQKSDKSINYVVMINWIWKNVPFMEGCKSSHIVLLLAIINAINRNFWKKTSISYGDIANVCKLSKETYIASRNWLTENGLLNIEPGKNGYQMAKFSLGLSVRIPACNYTSKDKMAVESVTGISISTPEIAVGNPTHNTLKPFKTINEEREESSPSFSYEEKKWFGEITTWIRGNAITVAEMNEPLTICQAIELRNKYPGPAGEKFLKEIIKAIHNYGNPGRNALYRIERFIELERDERRLHLKNESIHYRKKVDMRHSKLLEWRESDESKEVEITPEIEAGYNSFMNSIRKHPHKSVV